LRAIIGFLLLLILVIFLLSNRGPALVGFWPFGFLVSLPLGAVVIAAVIIGFLAGLAAHLPKRFAAHRRASKAEKRAAELEARLAGGPVSSQLQHEGRPSTVRS
jgi:uncharacterized integral membrane protein